MSKPVLRHCGFLASRCRAQKLAHIRVERLRHVLVNRYIKANVLCKGCINQGMVVKSGKLFADFESEYNRGAP